MGGSYDPKSEIVTVIVEIFRVYFTEPEVACLVKAIPLQAWTGP
jgi:hypothetical protein